MIVPGINIRIATYSKKLTTLLNVADLVITNLCGAIVLNNNDPPHANINIVNKVNDTKENISFVFIVIYIN